jgi:hypothetical protein
VHNSVMVSYRRSWRCLLDGPLDTLTTNLRCGKEAMSESNQKKSAPSASGTESAPTRKKTWHKPTYRFERVFETMALICGKVGTEGQCRLNRKAS